MHTPNFTVLVQSTENYPTVVQVQSTENYPTVTPTLTASETQKQFNNHASVYKPFLTPTSSFHAPTRMANVLDSLCIKYGKLVRGDVTLLEK